MLGDENSLNAIRDAISVSPENIPLRKHLAETLLALGRLEEAEQAYRDALNLASHSQDLKLGLAHCFYKQEKDSHALVIVEDLVKLRDALPGAYLLHARLLARAGDISFSISQYRQAVEEDPQLADEQFAQRLGIDADEHSEVVDGRLRAGWGEESEGANLEVERPKIRFEQVGGMEALKEEIRMKIIYPLQHPEMYEAYGKPIGGGILMYGPPGCGKTHIARATAGEIHAGFLSVGINDVLDMWIGSSERNLHELFDQARRNKPCVLFFDEVDALGASRSDMRQTAGRHLINQFLAELDGMNSNNEGVLVLAATNTPWHVDSAFRRPGRFDRILFVPPPDAPARAEIARILVKGKPQGEIDFTRLGKKTTEFSGADLKAVLDIAIEHKLQQAMKSGIPSPLETKDLLAAAKTVRPTTREWFATAKNYALYSNQGGLYDEILEYLNKK